MNIIIWPRGLQQKQKMPHSGEQQPDHDDPFWEFWRGEELTHGEEVCDAGYAHPNQERRFPHIAELAGADRQRQKQDGAESVQPHRWRELHSSPARKRTFSTVCPHSANQAAVRGALVGASRSSAASRIKSSATSIS